MINMTKIQSIAVIRVRGVNRVSHTVERTLRQLSLYRKNYCSVVPDTPSYRGMLAKVKDYVTYGQIDEDTYNQLIKARGQEYKGSITDSKGTINYTSRYVEIGNKKYAPFFRLQPPRGGFDRKGTKKAYSLGGALGFRGEEMKKLIIRMI